MVKPPQRGDKLQRNDKLAQHMGEVAREARLRQAMTQAEVAQDIGTVTAVYGRLERGDMLPSVPTLRRLCLALGESANTLLGLDEVAVPAWVALGRLETGEFAQVRRLLQLVQRLDDERLGLMVEMARVLLRHSRGGSGEEGE